MAVATFVAIGPPVSQLQELALDARVLAFAIVLSGGAAIVFGLWPAVQLSRLAGGGGLKDGSIRVTAGAGGRRFARTMVVAEVALALVLLAGAGLLVRSFLTLIRVEPGFVRSNVAAFQVFAYGQRYPSNAQRVAFFDQAIERMRALPGVEAAGLVSAMPFLPANIDIRGAFRVEGRPTRPDDDFRASLTVATREYFEAMRVPLLRGRLFSDADHADAPAVALVNDLLARQFWPNDNPVGERVAVTWQGQVRSAEVVGVVGPTRHQGLDRDPRPEVFLPFAQAPFGSMTFVVRTAGNPAELMPVLKARIWEVEPTLPFYDNATVDALVSQSLAPQLSMMRLATALAGLAFILTAAGIYGLLSFTTAQRTREMGVRIAMGARSPDILRLVVGEGAILVGIGIVLGLAGAIAATKVLAASLYQVSPTDPLTFAVTTTLLVAVALLACYVPARRATKVDPLLALRVE